MSDASPKPTVVIVGAGFAGVACAKELAKHEIPVTLIDRHNYQQFQPLLYQVATAELAVTDIARPIRAIFAKSPTVSMHQLEITSIDPETRTVTSADGQTFTGDYLVISAGAKPCGPTRILPRGSTSTPAGLPAKRWRASWTIPSCLLPRCSLRPPSDRV